MLRNKKLSKDKTPSEDVILDILKKITNTIISFYYNQHHHSELILILIGQLT